MTAGVPASPSAMSRCSPTARWTARRAAAAPRRVWRSSTPRGRLATKETLDHAGIVGTRFGGHVVGETEVAGIPAVVTEIEGSAHLTGHHQFILEKDDPLGPGFLLR